MVELIKDASNSIFTKNPVRRVFSNPVTYCCTICLFERPTPSPSSSSFFPFSSFLPSSRSLPLCSSPPSLPPYISVSVTSKQPWLVNSASTLEMLRTLMALDVSFSVTLDRYIYKRVYHCHILRMMYISYG